MINKVILVGRLGNDPERKERMVRFSLATSKRVTSGGEKKELTTWHNITAFDKIGELCINYLKKGSMIYVEGEISNFKKDDKYFSSVIIREIRFLSDKEAKIETPRAPVGFKDDLDPVEQAMSDEVPF